MRWSFNLERSQTTALWLFGVALLVLTMVVVGGATRLTGSGLSITEWKPILGVIPPLSEAGWQDAFHKYQQIPQYRLVNAGMSLSAFKGIYWWEWAHRLLGRLVGVAFVIPMGVLWWLKRLPRRLLVRCFIILGLGALQGLIGWWMVASGLDRGIAVAPERLAVHLGLALLIFVACIWTGLEAWSGRARASSQLLDNGWTTAAVSLLGAIYMQCLLGALVAGNQAGKINTDWPLMNGRWIPADYTGKGGLWSTLAHSVAAVQFNHRLVAYLILIAAGVMAVRLFRSRSSMARVLAQPFLWVLGAIFLQACLGVLTLVFAAPLGLALLHQIMAATVLALATGFAWRTARS
jgi:heme a synthase